MVFQLSVGDVTRNVSLRVLFAENSTTCKFKQQFNCVYESAQSPVCAMAALDLSSERALSLCRQMEKHAKQALAEGIRCADDIHVSTDSEVYKQLNQHYNRNNFIAVSVSARSHATTSGSSCGRLRLQPPETFPHVIEETLKEFYAALKEGKDSESSWKKTIYKKIQQLDDEIPECFKSQAFLAGLEGSHA